MHVDDRFKFKRYHALERYDQQNFMLNTVSLIISNILHHFIRSDVPRK